jgi:predicted DNA-binding transcriptional regulator YafY
MNRIDRLMGMITLLQSKKHRTLAQLAEHFHISERTVFRDLRALTDIGVPVHFDPEKGYSTGPDFFLPPISLTVEEANALSLAEPLIARFTDHSVQQHYGAALAKINMVLGRQSRQSMALTQQQMAHFIPDHYADRLPSTAFLTPLQGAITAQRVVRFTYQNADDEVSIREVEPIGLTFYSLHWHLIAWCHLRQAYRDFRVSRMADMRVTLQPFLKNDHPTLQAYLAGLQQEILTQPNHPLT